MADKRSYWRINGGKFPKMADKIKIKPIILLFPEL